MLIFSILVGFGDLYPKTPLGRLIIIVVSIIGIMTLSLLVATFQNELGLTSLEKNVYNTLGRLEVRDKIKERAKKVLKYMIRFNLISKRTKTVDHNVLYKVKQNLMKFKNIQRF